MNEPTDADRQRAVDLLRSVCVGAESTTVAIVATALAEERERAIEPFAALADEMQRQVEFRREGDPESLVADVRETDLRWLRLAIANAKDPR